MQSLSNLPTVEENLLAMRMFETFTRAYNARKGHLKQREHLNEDWDNEWAREEWLAVARMVLRKPTPISG